MHHHLVRMGCIWSLSFDYNNNTHTHTHTHSHTPKLVSTHTHTHTKTCARTHTHTHRKIKITTRNHSRICSFLLFVQALYCYRRRRNNTLGNHCQWPRRNTTACGHKLTGNLLPTGCITVLLVVVHQGLFGEKVQCSRKKKREKKDTLMKEERMFVRVFVKEGFYCTVVTLTLTVVILDTCFWQANTN